MEAYPKFSEDRDRMVIRPAEIDDIRMITTVMNASGGLSFYRAIFGTFHLPALIDQGYLSLVAESHTSDYSLTDSDKQSHIHGFISLNDQMSVVTEEYDFDSIINLVKEYIPLTINNTLLFNFWMANESRGNPAAYELIKEAFSLCTSIDFLVWICPFSYIVPESMEKLFTSILIDNAAANATKLRGYRILFSHRSNFLPKLSVRNARVEDNDDLIPIIQKSNPEILLGQDRYFLADLIQNQDANNRFFVGLKKNYIVGMLSTSLDVNMSLIMKMFDIDTYPDLVIQSDTVPPPPPLIIAIVGDLRLIEEEGLEEMLVDEHVLFINLEKISLNLGDYQNGEYTSSLMNYLQHLMSSYDNPAQLQAVVLWGFPRGESEAHDNLRIIGTEFDFILELINVSEEVDDDDDEDDEFLQQHLDGLEGLREYFTKEDIRRKATWKKVSYDQDSYHTNKKDNLIKLHNYISQCLDERLQRMEQAKAINKEKPPKANAFAITALCIEEEFSSRSADLLKLAFEEQPDFAYCLYMVNNQRPPTKETNCFNFIKTRPGISFDHSLYIINRSYFYAQEHLKINRIEESDMEQVQSYLSYLRPREKSDVVLSLKHGLRENDVSLNENPNCIGFSFKLGVNIVGTAVLTRKVLSNDDSNWFRQHYHLDEVVNSSRHRTKSQYILLHWMIDPIFSSWTRVIIRHLMRMCNKTVFFYHCDKNIYPPKEILEEFVFVRPKKVMDSQHLAFSQRPAAISTNEEGEEGNSLPPIPVFHEDSPLFCVIKSSLPFKKMIVATRVVILGGSAHSFACLETMFSVPNIYYPNIYFVVEVVPSPMRRNEPRNNSMENNDSILDDITFETKFCGCLSVQDVDFPKASELYAMGYAFRANIIKGRLTDIDRENRAIVVSDEFVVEYDYLIVSTYTQDNSFRLIPSLAGVHPAKCADAAIFALGNPAADLLALSWIKKRLANRSDPVIICGVAIKVFAAAEGLLKSGVEPSRIVLVVSDSADYIEGCTDQQICSLVTQSVEVAGISQIFWQSTVAEVSLSRNGFLQSVELKDLHNSDGRMESKMSDPTNPTRLSCTALLLCSGQQYQSCERDVFAAINDCGLVFDGGLVVDLAFRTVDQYIYGVSDYSKFSRVYRDELPHNRYNPREIGTYVAMQLIHKHLHPYPELFEISKHKLWKNATLVMGESKAEGIITKPRFSLARSYHASLPADTHFFTSSLPKLPKDSVGYLTDNANSTTASFGPIPPRRVMSMKIDSLGIVAEITYAGLEKVEFRNLSILPGQHESFLNSCVHAHRKNLVDDWIEYFRGEWAAIIFTADFNSFVKALKQSVQADKGMIMLLSRIFEKAETTLDDFDVDDYRRTLIGAHGELIPEITKKTLEAETAEYVREHKEFLPKYYVHGKTDNDG